MEVDMKTKRHIVFGIGLITALLTLNLSGCFYHHRTPEQRAEHMVQRLVSTLNLDAAQTAKLETMKAAYLARRPDMEKMRKESMQDLKEMMLSPQIDQARLKARTEKIQAHTDDLIRFVAAQFTELHDLLTPEQRSKLIEEMEQHARYGHHWN
jgi:Spy/CpxP family protein refolding chaperone